MNTNATEAEKLGKHIVEAVREREIKSGIVICPPFTNLAAVSAVVKDTIVRLGAQNCHYELKGAYTGEISTAMLRHFGCTYVIIGHSERRTYFFETDESVNKKAHAALNAGLTPIVCIGETLQERQENKTFDVLIKQMDDGLQGMEPDYAENIVIAYEPVWAIGTGISAETWQIAEAHAFIRKHLTGIFKGETSSVLILYGGSLNEENAPAILEIDDVNGGLIGGASLKGDSFLSIINTAEKLLH